MAKQLEFVAGTGIIQTAETVTGGGKLTTSFDPSVLTEATTSAAGLMSAADKTKLNGVAASANNYTHPTATAFTSGLYKVTVNNLGHVTTATAVAKADITALGVPAQDTTYAAATTSAAGLMAAADKTKLNGIATGAEVNVQSDWNQATTTADDFIKNKPDLTAYSVTFKCGTVTV
jgi:hypothetical protein